VIVDKPTLLFVTAVIVFFGGVGGVINALLTENGFVLPKRERTPGRSILRPGFVGNIFFGMAASFITWGLSGPFVNYSVIGTAEEVSTKFYLSLGNIVGAFLVGIGGARIVSNEVDKKLLSAAAVEAAGAPADSVAATTIASATPMGALKVAEEPGGDAKDEV
jgi:hypothetical protein